MTGMFVLLQLGGHPTSPVVTSHKHHRRTESSTPTLQAGSVSLLRYRLGTPTPGEVSENLLLENRDGLCLVGQRVPEFIFNS